MCLQCGGRNELYPASKIMINVSAVPPSDSLLGNYSSITLSESGRLGVGSYLEYREVRPGVYLNLLDLDTEL